MKLENGFSNTNICKGLRFLKQRFNGDLSRIDTPNYTDVLFNNISRRNTPNFTGVLSNNISRRNTPNFTDT